MLNLFWVKIFRYWIRRRLREFFRIIWRNSKLMTIEEKIFGPRLMQVILKYIVKI